MIYPLREEIFLRITPQTASLSGNKWRENNSLEPAHFELSRWLLFGGTKLFWKHLLKRPLPVGISREKIFDRTLKNILSHSSHYEDMYLDNWIKSPSSMTVRWPRKSERGDAAVRSRGRHTKGARKSGAYSAISKYLSNYLLPPEKKNIIDNCYSFEAGKFIPSQAVKWLLHERKWCAKVRLNHKSRSL